MSNEVTIPAGRYQHVKRGTFYDVVGLAELQMGADLVDGSALVVYRGEDGKMWAREEGEFMDGRFTPTPTPPSTEAQGEGEARSYFMSVIDDPMMLTETKADQLLAFHRQQSSASAAPSRPEDAGEAMREALAWYAEQVANCRKIGAIGDPARHALDRDGGERAREALAQPALASQTALAGGETLTDGADGAGSVSDTTLSLSADEPANPQESGVSGPQLVGEEAAREVLEQQTTISWNGSTFYTPRAALSAMLTFAARTSSERERRLVETLRPFAKAGELFDNEPIDPRWKVSIYRPAAGDDYQITDRHLRAARAALGGTDAE